MDTSARQQHCMTDDQLLSSLCDQQLFAMPVASNKANSNQQELIQRLATCLTENPFLRPCILETVLFFPVSYGAKLQHNFIILNPPQSLLRSIYYWSKPAMSNPNDF